MKIAAIGVGDLGDIDISVSHAVGRISSEPFVRRVWYES